MKQPMKPARTIKQKTNFEEVEKTKHKSQTMTFTDLKTL